MAVAREHFDGGGFRLLYGLPFSPSDSTPAIYFQPHTLVLGLLWRVTGWDPGVVFVVFGAAAAWLCARVALALYRELAGLEDTADRLGVLAFVWGGGLLVLAGLLAFWIRGGGVAELLTFEPLFALDPVGRLVVPELRPEPRPAHRGRLPRALLRRGARHPPPSLPAGRRRWHWCSS